MLTDKTENALTMRADVFAFKPPQGFPLSSLICLSLGAPIFFGAVFIIHAATAKIAALILGASFLIAAFIINQSRARLIRNGGPPPMILDDTTIQVPDSVNSLDQVKIYLNLVESIEVGLWGIYQSFVVTAQGRQYSYPISAFSKSEDVRRLADSLLERIAKLPGCETRARDMRQRFDVSIGYSRRWPWITGTLCWTMLCIGLLLMFGFTDWLPQAVLDSIQVWLDQNFGSAGSDRQLKHLASILTYVGVVMVHFGFRIEQFLGHIHLAAITILYLVLAIGLKYWISPYWSQIEILLLFDFLLVGTTSAMQSLSDCFALMMR